MNLRASLTYFREHASGPLASLTARNVASSFVALAWLSLLSMLTIPVYIRLLGVAEWGLVAACASLQILSTFIDAGFSQIVPKWVAHEAQNPERLRSYVALFRRIYICLGLLLFFLLQAVAGPLAHEWFQVSAYQGDQLELAIRIMSFQFLFQFINNLNIGLWYGLQHQVLANKRACTFTTLKHVLALITIIFGTQQAWVYALSFSLVSLLELVANTITTRRMLGVVDTESEAKIIAIKPLLNEVSLLSGGIFVGALASHLDKIVLSRTIDVESFGIYTTVVTLAAAFQQLHAPITRTYLPVFVQDIRTSGQITIAHLKQLLAGTLLFLILPALLTCAFAPMVLSLWLHDPKFVILGTAPLRLLLLAIIISSLYGCIYQVMLAAGKSGNILKFNILALFITALASMYFGPAAGISLGGFIWIANTFTQLTIGIFWLARNAKYYIKQ